MIAEYLHSLISATTELSIVSLVQEISSSCIVLLKYIVELPPLSICSFKTVFSDVIPFTFQHFEILIPYNGN